jgi:hypothetical protein
MEIALSKYCGPRDIITPISDADEATRLKLGFPGPRNYREPLIGLGTLSPRTIMKNACRLEWPNRYYNHIPAKDVREKVGEEVWNNYYKFTIVRHPFDRAISQFYWAGFRDASSFPTFLRRYSTRIFGNWEIVSEHDHFLLDDFIRYEELSYDISRVCTRIGLPTDLDGTLSTIRAKNTTRRSASSIDDLLGAGEKRFISYLCSAEMNEFNYDERF